MEAVLSKRRATELAVGAKLSLWVYRFRLSQSQIREFWMLGDQISLGRSPNSCLGAVSDTDFPEDSFDVDLNSRLRNFDLPRDKLV